MKDTVINAMRWVWAGVIVTALAYNYFEGVLW
jgi:hypothetical protein